MKPGFSNSLQFKQAKAIVLVTFAIGLVLNTGQIAIDLFTERKQVDATVMQVLSIVNESAVIAVYNMDHSASEKVVKGLFRYQPIHKVVIFDDEGETFVTQDRPLMSGYMEWLVKLVFGREKNYSITLLHPNEEQPIGRMEISVDNYSVLNNFMDRAKRVIFSGLIRNISLAFILTIFFFYSLVRPLLKIVEQVSSVNFEKPSAKLVEIPSGHEKNEIGLLVDITNRLLGGFGKSLTLVQNQNEQLKELDRMKDDFLANVTHELKTPLNGILGLGRAIQDGVYGTASETLHKPIDHIIISANRLLQLTLQILDFRPDRQMATDIQEVALKSYLETFMVQFEGLILGKGITMDSQVDPTLHIHIDQTHLETILTNLVGNAIKFTHEGHVHLIAQNLGTHAVAISVEDSGIGIPEKLHNKNFERFQQGFASESRAYEGTGLGLAIMKQSMEALRGAIHLDSTPGVGTIFTCLFPLRKELDQNTLLALWSQHPTRPQLSDSSAPVKEVTPQPDPNPVSTITDEMVEEDSLEASILVVDDDAINREVIRANLSQVFNVTEAENGNQCLEYLQQNTFDLILLDLMMPGVSGYDVLETLKKQNDLPPPVIILSAKDRISAMTRAFRMGSVDYVTKPFHKEELIARVRTHITLRRNADKIV